MQLSYESRLQIYIDRDKQNALDLLRRFKETANVKNKRDRDHIKYLEDMVNNPGSGSHTCKFILDANPYLQRFCIAQNNVKRYGRRTVDGETYVRECIKIHNEFLDKFGHDATPFHTDSGRQSSHKKAHNTTHNTTSSNTLLCSSCNPDESNVFYDPDTCYHVCRTCGLVVGSTKSMSAVPRYTSEYIQSTTTYHYEPITHFTNLLLRVQGKSSRKIPEDLIDLLRKECTLSRIDINNLRPVDIKFLLSQIKYPMYYAEKWKLTKLLNPTYKIVSIRADEFDLFTSIFSTVFSEFILFQKSKKITRQNFVSYESFAKLTAIFLGYDHIAREFSYLKSSEKERAQEDVLREIFASINFEFPR